ncbi:protein Mpv17-like isoform X2 [Lineus longissimus]
MATGDALAQKLLEKNTTGFDYKRNARFLGFGLFFAGPTLRFWYVFLDRAVKGKTALATVKRVALDQTVMAPLFLVSFISGMGALRGDSTDVIKSNLKRDFAPVLLNNYKLWPGVQLVNFYLVPLQHRLLVVNVVALGWNTYLAWMNERKQLVQDS